MNFALYRLAQPVVINRHALVQRVGFNDMPLAFSGLRAETEVAYQSTSKLGCPRSSPNPGNLNRLPGCFILGASPSCATLPEWIDLLEGSPLSDFLRSYNSLESRKRRLPQQFVSPHVARGSPGLPQVHLESQGLAEPSLRDRHATDRARVIRSLPGQTRKHPGVAPTTESKAPAIGAVGKLTAPPRWQARCRPAISRGQSDGWVNSAHQPNANT